MFPGHQRCDVLTLDNWSSSDESPAGFRNDRLGHARRKAGLLEVKRIRRRKGLEVLKRQMKHRWLFNSARSAPRRIRFARPLACGAIGCGYARLTGSRASIFSNWIADLQALRRPSKAAFDSCRCGTVVECRIIKALGPVEDVNVGLF